MLGNHTTTQLQGISQLATLHREGLGQQGETLDFLVSCQVGLTGLDAGGNKPVNLRIGQQLLDRIITDTLRLGILFQQRLGRYDQGCHKLTFISDDSNLIDIEITRHTQLDRLRSNVLSVRGLVEILDTLGEIQGVAL